MFEIEWDRESFDRPVWLCIDENWLYMHDTLSGVLYQLEHEYKHDKHLAG